MSSVKPEKRPYLLRNKIQHYEWGSRGKTAFIANLLGFEGKSDTPYAELWIGAHPKAPSEVVLNDVTWPLNNFISCYPEQVLGKRVSAKFAKQLPFLFKVLSAAEVLSIQAHPNKVQAEALHQRDPEHYPDPNHKPEIAIALDCLEALVGFKPVEELAEIGQKYPEIAQYIGSDVWEELEAAAGYSAEGKRKAVKKVYGELIRRSIVNEPGLMRSVEQLKKRLRSFKGTASTEEKLFLRLTEKYPDVGLFSIFFLNLVRLEKGEGIFIEAGIPHAYLEGNIVECMSNSDNVVRVGLTPKFKDGNTLIDILTYDTGAPQILRGNEVNGEIAYPCPAEEFRVSRLHLESSDRKEIVKSDTPEVFLLINGKIHLHWKEREKVVTEVWRKGDALLVPAIVDRYALEAMEESEVYRVVVP